MFLYKVKVGNDSTVYSERNMKDKSHPQVAFKNGAGAIRSYSHAETYRIVKTYV